MRKFATLGAALTLFAGCQSPFKVSNSSSFSGRRPASAEDLFTGADKVLLEIQDDSIFNARTCSTYINSVTDYLYNMGSDYFVPKTPREVEAFRAHGPDLLKTLFLVRVTLREKYQQFDEHNELTNECMLKVREGVQYSRITEEYLLEWLVHNKVIEARTPPILSADSVFTMTNPKFEDFKLQAGDLMLVRGKSYVSAMIARIGDEEGNFSHLAIVTEDEKGSKFVVESLIQTGIIITPLHKWLQAQDARVALYRQRDPELAKRAGRLMYEYSRKRLNKDGEVRYDFAMDDAEYDAFFCSEVARYAYDKASGGKVLVPKFRSAVSKFKNTEYPKSLGVTKSNLFAPYDIEADPRFDFVAEYKYYPLLRQVRMQDAVLQSVYEWMIKKDYEFHFNFTTSFKSYLGKFIRQFGLVKDVMPKYMPLQTIKTTAQFEAVATILEKNLYAKEDEFYKTHGYLPTFREFMVMNEEFRRQDCEAHQEFLKQNGSGFRGEGLAPGDKSKFSWFFYSSKNKSCSP